MFLRRCERRKSGKKHSYWALVESYRTAVGSRQRVVAYLGELKPSEKNGWAFCLANLARLTGQRALDVDETMREGVLVVLRSLKVPAPWPEMVERVVHMEAADRGQLFGESLPIGLRLIG